MNLELRGKRALVMGSSRGLGYAIAEALAGEGARVALVSRDAERVEGAAERLRGATGAEVHALTADLADPEGPARTVAAARERLGGLDALLNNAGGPPPGAFEALDEAAWARGFELTLMSVVRTLRAALPVLAEDGGGAALTVLSSSVGRPIPNLDLSNTFRPALAALTVSLAKQWAPRGVRLNGLAPGRILTGRTDELDRARAERAGSTMEAVRAASVATIPLGRLGAPEEFARTAAFLLSPAASYLTGVTLRVDGGMVDCL